MDPPKKTTRHPVFFSKKRHHFPHFHHFHMRFPVQKKTQRKAIPLPLFDPRTWGIWKPLILPCAAPSWWGGTGWISMAMKAWGMWQWEHEPWTIHGLLVEIFGDFWHAIWKLLLFLKKRHFLVRKIEIGFPGEMNRQLSCWTSSQKDSTFLHCLIVSISFKVFWFSTMETGWWSYMINDEHKHLQTSFFFSRFEPPATQFDLCWPRHSGTRPRRSLKRAKKTTRGSWRSPTCAMETFGGCYVIYVCTEHGIMWANGQVIGLPVVSWFHHVWPPGD